MSSVGVPLVHRAPDEQVEALNLVKIQYPKAAALIGTPLVSATSTNGCGRPRSSQSPSTSPPAPPVCTEWAHSLTVGGPEGAPLDERIDSLYFAGKRASRVAEAMAKQASVRPSASPASQSSFGSRNRGCSPCRDTVPMESSLKSFSPSARSARNTCFSRSSARDQSPAERSASRLHQTGTISSTISRNLRHDLTSGSILQVRQRVSIHSCW